MASKELVINKNLYAYYEADGTMLYMKSLIEIETKFLPHGVSSEDILIAIIESVEQTSFKQVACLNI